MRIISKFKDYYDGVGRGIPDGDICYVRRTTNHEVEGIETLKIAEYNIYTAGIEHTQWYANHRVFFFNVHFCGRQYPIVTLVKTKNSYCKGDTDTGNLMFGAIHTMETFQEYLQFAIENIKRIKVPTEEKSKYAYSRRYGFHKCMNKFFDQRGKASELNKQYNSPVVVEAYYLPNYLHVVDCKLDSIGFASVMDTYQVWQEISMWMGTIHAKSENQVVTISDKDRLQQHGFNEYNFRKPKEKYK